MRILVAVLSAALLLAGCATPPPPGPVTGTDRTGPYQLTLARPMTSIPVDGDTAFTVPGFVATSPAGLVGGLIGQAVVAAIEAPAAQRRAERRNMLQGSLGETGAAAETFGTTFDATLEAALRELPGLEVVQVDPPGAAAARLPGAARIGVVRDALLSVDARMLIGRASVAHAVPTATGRLPVRHFLYFSQPVEASGDAHATALWQEENGRLLRERSAEVARGLARLVREQLFDIQPVDTGKATTLRITTPGVQFLPIGFAYSPQRPPRLLETVRAYVVRREPDRALVLFPGPLPGPDWVWISVPASALPAPGS